MGATAEDARELVRWLRVVREEIEPGAEASDILERGASDIERLSRGPDLEAAANRADQLWLELHGDPQTYRQVFGDRAIKSAGARPQTEEDPEERLVFFFNKVRRNIAEGVHRQSVPAPDGPDEA